MDIIQLSRIVAMTTKTKRNLRTFENEIWNKLCGFIIDKLTGNWRKRHNKEFCNIMEVAPITSFVKGQLIYNG